jgi:membrane-anchored glycerophosphoryl diester phosphodiesterase (GDPDase)
MENGESKRGAVRTVLALFRRGWAPLVGYELFFKMVLFSVATPLAGWLIKILISASGEKSVTNLGVISFLLSEAGVATVITAGALYLAAQLAEEAGLFIIAARNRAGKRITAWRALAGVARKLPALLGAALAEFLVVLAWTVPVLGVGGLLYFICRPCTFSSPGSGTWLG